MHSITLLFSLVSSLFYLWQVGFVLHSDSIPPYSTCGCENTAETCQYLTPALVTSAASIQNVSSLGITDFSGLLTEVCSTFNDSIANCEQLPTTAWFYEAYSGSLGACIERFSCNAGSDCQCINSSQCLVGETSIPPDTMTTEKTATIWYNNQVLQVAKLLSTTSNSLFFLTIFSTFTYHLLLLISSTTTT